MKIFTAVAIFVMCLNHTSQAQSDTVALNKFYHVWIIPVKGQQGESGILYELKDSAVMVSNSPWKENYSKNNFDVTRMDVRYIKEIRVRRQGAGFAVLIGGISGMAVGALISAAYMDHLEKTMNSFGFVLGGFFQGILPFIVSTGIGFGVGGMVSAKLKIPIRGSQDEYDQHKTKLNKYALKSNSNAELFNGKSFSKFRDTVVDIDGNVYNTLLLGGQLWIASNLRVTHFRDGSEIPGAVKNISGSDPRYDWVVVNDARKLCPAGWHVPSLSEWTSLYNSLGGEENAGRRLEESFSTNGPVGQWWSSTLMDSTRAQSFYQNNRAFGVMFAGVTKTTGLSVRCMRDN